MNVFCDAHVFAAGDFESAVLWIVSDRGWMRYDIAQSPGCFTTSGVDMAMLTAEAMLQPYIAATARNEAWHTARVYVHPSGFSYVPGQGSAGNREIDGVTPKGWASVTV